MLKNFDRFIGNSVTLFVIIAYFQLFKFIVIPHSIRVIAEITAMGLMLILILLRLIYQPKSLIRMNFAGPILVLILSAIPSYFIAQSFHDQSFLVSTFANRIIWFFLLYFFVHVFQVSVKAIIRMIIAIGIFVVVLYYIQLTIYPKVLLDIVMLKSRGTLRLLVAGMLCTQVAYFYFLNRFFENSRLKDLLLSLLILSIFVLQGSRHAIIAIFLLTIVMLFFSRRVKGRFLKVGIVVLASFSLFLIFRDIFIELTKVSMSQVGGFEGGIRLKAAKFFLTNFQPDEWSYIFGNSRSGSGSIYSQRSELYAHKYGFHLSDIGILGDYIRYGILFVIASVYLLVKSIGFKVSPEYRYLKYYIIMQCFTLATGKGILGEVDVAIILILYIFDVDRSQQILRSKDVELEVKK